VASAGHLQRILSERQILYQTSTTPTDLYNRSLHEQLKILNTRKTCRIFKVLIDVNA
jgi:hypothetical protein